MKLWYAFFGMLLAMSLLASPASAANDLSEKHGFYEEINYLIDQGVVTGYPDGTIRPDRIVTRAEAAIMIGRLKGLDGTQRDSEFSDVTKGMRASGYIASAQEAGYISGYEDGTFDPYAPIVRGDMAIILSKVFVAPFSGVNSYSDVSANMKAHDAIHQVTAASIAAGYTNGTFKPYATTTRGQFSAFLARGVEPKFQNDTHMAGSFLKDKTKTYHYGDGETVHSVHVYTNDTDQFDMPLGFVWAADDQQTEDINYYMEYESRNGLYTAYPYSEIYLDLVYPVEVGKEFNTDSPFAPRSVITDVDVTVETPYTTFTNAVEVHVPETSNSQASGYTYYLVPGYGDVKSVDDDGTLRSVLMNVE